MCRHYPRKYFDKRVRLRVYEKLSADERIKCGSLLDNVADNKTNKNKSKWSHIIDLLCDIMDPYYVAWVVGIVLSSPVSLALIVALCQLLKVVDILLVVP